MGYRVQFTGQLKKGVSRKQTLTILSKLTQKSVEETEARFFGGSPVNIREFDLRSEAEAYQAKLLKIGLHLQIHDSEGKPDDVKPPPTTPNAAGKAAPKVADKVADTPKPNASPVKKILGAVAVLLIAVASGFYWLHTQLNPSPSEWVVKAENALHGNNTLVLGHVNVAQITKLESIVAPPQSTGAPDPKSHGLLDQLLLNGIDLRKNIDDIVFSLSADEAGNWFPNVVIVGNFNQAQANAFFKSYYDIEPYEQGLLFKKQDRLSCEYSEQRGVKIEDGLIVVSAPDNLQALVNSLHTSPAVPQLPASWQTFRATRLASVGILQPEQSVNALPGMLKMMAAGMLQQQTPISAAYLGLQGHALPPSVSLDALITSPDQHWLQQVFSQANTGLKQAKAKIDQAPDFIQHALADLSLATQHGQMSASVSLDKTLAKQIQNTLEQGMGSLFRLGGSTNANDNTVKEEFIDEQAVKYTPSVNVSSLPDFKPDYGKTPLWQKGPVGLFVEAARINKSGQPEIDVLAIAQNIPNPANDNFSELGNLKILRVLDKQGNDLLKQETCGMQINQDPAPFKTMFVDQAQAKKTIRLKDGAKIGDIASIQGKLSVNIAEQVNVEVIPTPINESQLADSQVTIHRADFSQLKFTASTPQKILNIRALNDKKQVLRSSSFGFRIGSSNRNAPKTLDYSIQGKIAYVEVVSIQQQNSLEYSFSLDRATPKLKTGDGMPVVKPTLYQQEDWDKLTRYSKMIHPEAEKNWQGAPIGRQHFGPIITDFYPFGVQNGFKEVSLRSRIHLYLPHLEGLDHYANLVNLKVDQILLANGESYQLNGNSLMSFGRQSKNKTEIKHSEHYPHTQNQLVNLMVADAQMNQTLAEISRLEEKSDAVELRGTLSFRLPQNVIEHKVPIPNLGEPLQISGVTLTAVEISSHKYTFMLSGDTSAIGNLMLLNDEGNNVGFRMNVRAPNNFDQFHVPDTSESMVGEISLTRGEPKMISLWELIEVIENEFDFSVINPAI